MTYSSFFIPFQICLVVCLCALSCPLQTKQNKTKQNKTKQNKTKQNKTKQNKNTKNPLININQIIFSKQNLFRTMLMLTQWFLFFFCLFVQVRQNNLLNIFLILSLPFFLFFLFVFFFIVFYFGIK
jgi:hypothetical protein